MDSFRSYLARFLTRRAELTASITCPVLFFEPQVPPGVIEDELSGEYRLRTASGVGPRPGLHASEPLVLLVHKSKDNAFQRGVTVGRTGNNDVVLDDGSVSRFHAWFQKDERTGEWTLADAGSKNGTLLAGTKLKPKRPVPLPDHARLQFGEVVLTLFSPARFLSFLEERVKE